MVRRTDRGRRQDGRARNERGTAVVEFAIVAPLLLMLVFGIIDFGRLIETKTVLADAAREGARSGSISHSEAVIRSSVTSALGDIPASAVTITVGCTGPAPTYTPCPAGGFDANVKSGGTVQVTVKYHYNWLTPIPTLIGLGNNKGDDVTETVQMRVE